MQHLLIQNIQSAHYVKANYVSTEAIEEASGNSSQTTTTFKQH